MDSAERSLAENNFRLALELFELGEKMTRERLRRENPGASEWEGVNLYEVRGEVRVFILAPSASAPPPAKGKSP